jgi:endonuclease/exonuclease/phosphatase family metal-dependent hydrolase
MKTTFTTMTFNIGNGLAPVERLRAYLLEAAPDIVALQEVDGAQAEGIEHQLSDAFPFRIIRPGCFTGRAILSRFPIVSHEWMASDPSRPDVRAIIDLDGQELTIVNAHPSPPKPTANGWVFGELSRLQIRKAVEVAIATRPALLVGDLNMTARHPAYTGMREAGLVDVWSTQGKVPGKTLPVRMGQSRRFQRGFAWMPLRPVARVDYIWHTGEFVTEAAWLGDDAGSDHLPVLATLSTREL